LLAGDLTSSQAWRHLVRYGTAPEPNEAGAPHGQHVVNEWSSSFEGESQGVEGGWSARDGVAQQANHAAVKSADKVETVLVDADAAPALASAPRWVWVSPREAGMRPGGGSAWNGRSVDRGAPEPWGEDGLGMRMKPAQEELAPHLAESERPSRLAAPPGGSEGREESGREKGQDGTEEEQGGGRGDGDGDVVERGRGAGRGGATRSKRESRARCPQEDASCIASTAVAGPRDVCARARVGVVAVVDGSQRGAGWGQRPGDPPWK
jgi:hypothetical protein